MRALYLKDGFPTHRVRTSEHEEELILPEFAEIRDDNQAHPVTETCQWMDAVYEVNTHHSPIRRVGPLTIARLCIAPTSGHDITEVRRIHDGKRTNTYSLVAAAKSLSNADRAVLKIEQNPFATRLTVEGKELFYGTPAEEHLARELIQPIVQELLADLGYGDPDEFAKLAVDLDHHRQSHNINLPSMYVA